MPIKIVAKSYKMPIKIVGKKTKFCPRQKGKSSYWKYLISAQKTPQKKFKNSYKNI